MNTDIRSGCGLIAVLVTLCTIVLQSRALFHIGGKIISYCCNIVQIIGYHCREVIGIELYNHTNDPSLTFGDYENVNLAYLPSMQSLQKELHETLYKNWALPEQL
eukprot:m.158045 g.158045  ORF g.158045 m.158045 type:complete len:105 (+) comp15125_c0_seq3:1478-1792(+)